MLFCTAGPAALCAAGHMVLHVPPRGGRRSGRFWRLRWVRPAWGAGSAAARPAGGLPLRHALSLSAVLACRVPTLRAATRAHALAAAADDAAARPAGTRHPAPRRHGGPAAARFVRDHLFKNLLGHHAFEANLVKAVEDAYQVGSSCGVCVFSVSVLRVSVQQGRPRPREGLCAVAGWAPGWRGPEHRRPCLWRLLPGSAAPAAEAGSKAGSPLLLAPHLAPPLPACLPSAPHCRRRTSNIWSWTRTRSATTAAPP